MNRQVVLEYLKSQKSVFEKKYQLTGIGLFGSFAREEQNPESDIDIVYSMPEGVGMSFFQMIELENEIQQHLHRKVELVNYKYLDPVIKFKAEKEIVYV